MKKLTAFLLIAAQLCVGGANFTGATGYVPNPFRYIGAQFRDYTHSHYMGAVDLPEEFDLRKTGNGIAPIRNQGGCGSCWWFGTKEVVEDLVKLRDNKDIEISGQWGVDCSPQSFAGCGGGDAAFGKFDNTHGAIYESEYPRPYKAYNQKCETSWLKEGHYHEQVFDPAFIKRSTESVQRAIFENVSPVLMTVGAGGLNPDSKGWVTSCRSASTNHIVTVVGWLRGEKHGYPAGLYWIMKNSWAKSWGDDGFAYVLDKKGSTYCASLGAEEVISVAYKSACTPQAKADAGPDKKIYEMPGSPESVRIGTPALEGMTYVWSPKEGLDDAAAAQPYASPKVTTHYSVKVTSKCGDALAQMVVHVYHQTRNGDWEESK